MGVLAKKVDAYGREIRDYLNGIGSAEICERQDGHVALSSGPAAYFAEFKDWPEMERRAIRLARGRVLDVGCGAARVGLYLQEKGFKVTGIDNSPFAIEVSRKRGLKDARLVSATEFAALVGTYGTVVMFGNNFGLMGGMKRGKWLLRRFCRMTTQDARILAESNDPYKTDVLEHHEYQRENRRHGRMSGQLRLRIRYRKCATPWFDYLLASKEEMKEMAKGTGWRVTRFIDSKGSAYIGVLEKE